MPSIAVSNAKETLRTISNKFAMLPAELISSQNPSAMAAYAALDMCASTGESPSLTNISRITGLARPTVRRARDWLVQNGYIEMSVTGTGRTPSRYTLLGGRGNELLPLGEHNVTPPTPKNGSGGGEYKGGVKLVTRNNGTDTSNGNGNGKRVTSKLVSSIPEWFTPITMLQGYKNRDYRKTIVAIEQVCSTHSVLPSDVMAEFIDYYPIGQAQRNWKDPVPCLLRTLTVQVAKVEGKGKSAQRVSANAMTLDEEIEFQRDTGIRPSSVQADTIRADWLKKYRER